MTTLKFDISASGIPKSCSSDATTDCPKKCGDDSFGFVETDGFVALAVSDGVTGMRYEFPCVKIGEFSQALTLEFIDTLKQFNSYEDVDLKSVMLKSFEAIKERKILGAATAHIILVDKNTGQFSTANVGDSGSYILTKKDGAYKINYKSEHQGKGFNVPYCFDLEPSGHTTFSENKLYFKAENYRLQSGDVILSMTDGVSDNLLDSKVEMTVDYQNSSARLLSRNLAQYSYYASKSCDSCPFNVKAANHGYSSKYSGKPDDITIIAAIIN